jgi:hypothetical protein
LPWPVREWLCTCLSIEHGHEHPLVRHHVTVWRKELADNETFRTTTTNQETGVQWSNIAAMHVDQWYAWVDQNLIDRSIATAQEAHAKRTSSSSPSSSSSHPFTYVSLPELRSPTTNASFVVQFVNNSKELAAMQEYCLSTNDGKEQERTSVLAFDFEWHPSLSNKIAIGQFACGNVVFIIDSYNMNDVENLMWIEFMEQYAASGRVLVGFGIQSDLKMLTRMKQTLVGPRASNGLVLQNRKGEGLVGGGGGLVDLQRKKKRQKTNSLADLVLEHFPQQILNKTCTLTNWLRRPLGIPQIEYAALDAVVCLLVYQKLNVNN